MRVPTEEQVPRKPCAPGRCGPVITVCHPPHCMASSRRNPRPRQGRFPTGTLESQFKRGPALPRATPSTPALALQHQHIAGSLLWSLGTLMQRSEPDLNGGFSGGPAWELPPTPVLTSLRSFPAEQTASLPPEVPPGSSSGLGCSSEPRPVTGRPGVPRQ